MTDCNRMRSVKKEPDIKSNVKEILTTESK